MAKSQGPPQTLGDRVFGRRDAQRSYGKDIELPNQSGRVDPRIAATQMQSRNPLTKLRGVRSQMDASLKRLQSRGRR